jgi:hypothetical protein
MAVSVYVALTAEPLTSRALMVSARVVSENLMLGILRLKGLTLNRPCCRGLVIENSTTLKHRTKNQKGLRKLQLRTMSRWLRCMAARFRQSILIGLSGK